MAHSATMPSPAAGLLFAAGSALCLSILTTAAAFAYKGGSDPVTVIAVRAMAGLLGSGLLVMLFRVPVKLLPGIVPLMAVMCSGQLMINFGYLTSVLYIPVSLAALIFYIFPVLVLVVEAVQQRRRPALTELIIFIAAFAGLALALGPSFEGLDWRGLLGALIAALGGVLLMLAGNRVTHVAGTLRPFFHSQIVAFVITTAVMLVFGGPNLPETDSGWWGLGVACAGYVAGVGLQFAAIKLAEPATASLVYNLEPLATLLIAAWLLAERLSLVQYSGGALVLVAIVIASQRAVRR